jgi:hypothetical protein
LRVWADALKLTMASDGTRNFAPFNEIKLSSLVKLEDWYLVLCPALDKLDMAAEHSDHPNSR